MVSGCGAGRVVDRALGPARGKASKYTDYWWQMERRPSHRHDGGHNSVRSPALPAREARGPMAMGPLVDFAAVAWSLEGGKSTASSVDDVTAVASWSRGIDGQPAQWRRLHAGGSSDKSTGTGWNCLLAVCRRCGMIRRSASSRRERVRAGAWRRTRILSQQSACPGHAHQYILTGGGVKMLEVLRSVRALAVSVLTLHEARLSWAVGDAARRRSVFSRNALLVHWLVKGTGQAQGSGRAQQHVRRIARNCRGYTNGFQSHDRLRAEGGLVWTTRPELNTSPIPRA